MILDVVLRKKDEVKKISIITFLFWIPFNADTYLLEVIIEAMMAVLCQVMESSISSN